MGNDRRSKEASDTGQWERMQTGRVSEHFWAKSDYVGRGALLIMPRPLSGCQIKAEIQGFLLMYRLFLY